MKEPIPRSALYLGLAGLLPFLLGAATVLSHNLYDLTRWTLGPDFTGITIARHYGLIILCFMAGVLWGFATKGPALLPYLLSVLPALWAFFAIGRDDVLAVQAIIAGFLGLLALDGWFWKQGLAPGWWLRLRLGLTVVVVVCLGVTLNG